MKPDTVSARAIKRQITLLSLLHARPLTYQEILDSVSNIKGTMRKVIKQIY